MEGSFTFISRGPPLSEDELSVTPMFKDIHFSHSMALKHQPTALSGAQPKEQRSRLVWAVCGFHLVLL